MEQSLQQVLFIPEVMSAAEFGRLENARRCGVRHHTFESVQVREPDSIAIDKKGLLGRMCGAVDSAVDAGRKYFEWLKHGKKTGHSGGKAKQKGVEGENGQGAGGGERPWLAELARIREIISGRMVFAPAGAERASWGEFGGNNGYCIRGY